MCNKTHTPAPIKTMFLFLLSLCACSWVVSLIWNSFARVYNLHTITWEIGMLIMMIFIYVYLYFHGEVGK
jgi:hypothetical protein